MSTQYDVRAQTITVVDSNGVPLAVRRARRFLDITQGDTLEIVLDVDVQGIQEYQRALDTAPSLDSAVRRWFKGDRHD